MAASADKLLEQIHQACDELVKIELWLFNLAIKKNEVIPRGINASETRVEYRAYLMSVIDT